MRRSVVSVMKDGEDGFPEPLVYMGMNETAFLFLSMMSFKNDYEPPDWDTKGMANERT